MAYTNEQRVKDFLGISTLPDPLTSDRVSEYIDAVQNWIETYTGRKFEQESATYKLYDGDGTKELLIDDLISLDKIEILDEDGDVDYTIDDATEYYLYPANETPKTRIVLNVFNAPISYFPKGHQNVKVTGTFGYASTVPEDIRLVATKLVAGIIEEKYIKEVGVIKSERLGEYSVTIQDIEKMANRLGVLQILDRYRKIEI